jgi:hypothetical protein
MTSAGRPRASPLATAQGDTAMASGVGLVPTDLARRTNAYFVQCGLALRPFLLVSSATRTASARSRLSLTHQAPVWSQLAGVGTGHQQRSLNSRGRVARGAPDVVRRPGSDRHPSAIPAHVINARLYVFPTLPEPPAWVSQSSPEVPILDVYRRSRPQKRSGLERSFAIAARSDGEGRVALAGGFPFCCVQPLG